MWYVHDVEGGSVVSDEAVYTTVHDPSHVIPQRAWADRERNRLIAVDMQIMGLDRKYPGRMMIGGPRVRR